jgi:hypothetical protein
MNRIDIMHPVASGILNLLEQGLRAPPHATYKVLDCQTVDSFTVSNPPEVQVVVLSDFHLASVWAGSLMGALKKAGVQTVITLSRADLPPQGGENSSSHD